MSLKIIDSSKKISTLSRLDQYWHSRGFENLYTGISGRKLPPKISAKNIDSFIIKEYHLNDIEFGNWVTNEDRMNYLASLYFALHDLNSIIGFNKNIGLENSISVAFGARGMGSAAAHYEPSTEIINITRYYKTTADNKKYAFETSGGMGAFAHEYGHALDYFFGQHIEQSINSASLTAGNSTKTKFKNTAKHGTMRYWANEIILHIIWVLPGTDFNKKTNYYEKLQRNFNSEYWFRQNELFARAFEQYIHYKLVKSGVKNKLLSKSKYESSAYMSKTELKRVIPMFDQLIKLMAQKVKS